MRTIFIVLSLMLFFFRPMILDAAASDDCPDGNIIRGEAVERGLKSYIKDKVSDLYAGSLILKVLRPIQDICLPEGSVEFRYYHELPNKKDRPLPKRMNLKIHYMVDNVIITHLFVVVEFKRSLNVVVARTPIKRGDIVTEARVELVQREIDIFDDVIERMEDAIGKVSRRYIKEGDVLMGNLLESPADLQKGEDVDILLESSNFKIVTGGTLKSDARLGERVYVVNKSSGKDVCGTLIDLNTVQVDY